MKKQTIKTACFVATFFMCISMYAQNLPAAKKTFNAWDGMIVAGYVNDGGYVNFGGPALKIVRKPLSLSFGVLPTLRIKEDKVAKGAMKNSIVMPTLGFGITAAYKHLVLQVPVYYNAKTALANGKWNVGVGIGFKLY